MNDTIIETVSALLEELEGAYDASFEIIVARPGETTKCRLKRISRPSEGNVVQFECEEGEPNGEES